ncbi:DUF5813 family protein [Halorussus caseinilyticus]|uniref:DUF5813 family protein n=1 Tax=Halorussus caseinilyticus TaxID=3034025 RepID=A0ABD5WPV2_9EURY
MVRDPELRLDDAHTVADADAAPPEIEREGTGEDAEVVVTVAFDREDPERAAEDALAIAEYVEGTWVQGIIPGYDYREPAAGLRERARQNYDEDGAAGDGTVPASPWRCTSGCPRRLECPESRRPRFPSRRRASPRRVWR